MGSWDLGISGSRDLGSLVQICGLDVMAESIAWSGAGMIGQYYVCPYKSRVRLSIVMCSEAVVRRTDYIVT